MEARINTLLRDADSIHFNVSELSNPPHSTLRDVAEAGRRRGATVRNITNWEFSRVTSEFTANTTFYEYGLLVADEAYGFVPLEGWWFFGRLGGIRDADV